MSQQMCPNKDYSLPNAINAMQRPRLCSSSNAMITPQNKSDIFE